MKRVHTFLGTIAFCVIASLTTAAPNPDNSPSQRDVVYGRADDQDLKLDAFFVPADAGTTKGAILLIHGGGWSGGDKAAYHADAKWFAQKGFASFSVGYRLVKPEKNKWPSQLDDIQLAVRWARENAAKYDYSPHSIGAIGASAGGHLVSLLGTRETRDTSGPLAQHSSRVNCVVDVFGPADLTQDFPTSAPFNLNVQKLVDDFLGKPAKANPELARDASPMFHIDKSTAPFLIFHGPLDALVPLNQSVEFDKALRSAGVESKLVIMEGEGHGYKPETLGKLRKEAAAFFELHFTKK